MMYNFVFAVGSTCLFSALLKRCHDREVVPVCWYKRNSSAAPKLVALIPQPEEVDEAGIQTIPPGFHLVKLPFAGTI